MGAFQKKKILLHIILPLAIGVLIYIMFRKPVLYLHQQLGQHSILVKLPGGVFSSFLKFQLPDVLWAYSFTSCLTIFWRVQRITIAAYSIFSVSLYECLPLLFQRGSFFDWADIICMNIAVLLSLLIVKP